MFKDFFLNVELIHIDAKVPTKAYEGDAGYDLYAVESATVWPGLPTKIPIGIKTEFPSGYYCQIKDRSGWAVKHQLHVIAGVIDAEYRGEWIVVALNLGSKIINIKKGDKIAQFVVIPIWDGTIHQVEFVSNTERGGKRYGSSDL
jgi:dUTP pyrophosphatase